MHRFINLTILQPLQTRNASTYEISAKFDNLWLNNSTKFTGRFFRVRFCMHLFSKLGRV